MRSSRRSTARLPRYAAAALLAGLVTLAAGCSGGGGQDSGSTAASAPQPAGDFGQALNDSLSLDGKDAPERAAGSANRAAVQTRAVIRTARITVTSKDMDTTREELDDLLFALGGTIDSEQTTHDDKGKIDRSRLVLRVPVTKFAAAIDSLEKLGTVKSSQSASKDVTTEVIDVNERVETTQESLDRLQGFLRRSQNIDDLIRFEKEITARESELQSLKAQQAYLLGQTAMSTITLSLSTPATYVAPPDALADAGFLTGLTSGWNALKDSVVVALTVVGAMLPFAVAGALLGVPTWLLVRAFLRRRTADPAPPVASEAG